MESSVASNQYTIQGLSQRVGVVFKRLNELTYAKDKAETKLIEKICRRNGWKRITVQEGEMNNVNKVNSEDKVSDLKRKLKDVQTKLRRSEERVKKLKLNQEEYTKLKKMLRMKVLRWKSKMAE